MKKYLKIFVIFAALFFTAQAWGQGWEDDGWDPWDPCEWFDCDPWDWDPYDDYDEYHWEEGTCKSCVCGKCGKLFRFCICTCVKCGEQLKLCTCICESCGKRIRLCICPSGITHLKIMTYNVASLMSPYFMHAGVINGCGADVVCLQEVECRPNFNELKRLTGLSGMFCVISGKLTIFLPPHFNFEFGNVILWNKSKVGNPNIKNVMLKSTKAKDKDSQSYRAYTIAGFKDFMIINTHFSLYPPDRVRMADHIVNNETVQDYISSGKPVYIAGDFNEGPNSKTDHSMIHFINAGFEILNKQTGYYDPPGSKNWKWDHATRITGSMIDMILEYNNNPNKAIIDRGIPDSFPDSFLEVVSDHKPYFVKVKLK